MELEVYFEARKDFGEERGGFGRFWEVWEWQGNVVFFALESPEHSRFFIFSKLQKSIFGTERKLIFVFSYFVFS